MNDSEKLENEQETKEKLSPQGNFLMSLLYLNRTYLVIVISSAIIAILGIFIALQFVLWIGVAVAFTAALAYMAFTKLALKVALDMSYESTSGAITITKVKPKEQSEIFIPRRIFWVNVTSLGNNAFVSEHSKELHIVHLPATITEIGENVFEGCDSLERIYFEGTREEWEKIECATELGDVEIIFCDTALYAIPKTKKDKKSKKEADASSCDTAPIDTEDNG